MSDFDLFVIGAGSGGVRAARLSAGMGARVAIAEERYMGGTCVNVGCIPKKLYSLAAHYPYALEDSRGFGWSGSAQHFDWATLRDNKTAEIDRLNGVYQRLLENSGCEIIDGFARITGPNTVTVGEKSYQCEKILIATGGWPWVPDIPGRELVQTSNEIFDLPTFPERILIVGGGYIAVEFAGIFAGLGAETAISYRGDSLLRHFDQDLQRSYQQEAAHYMEMLLGTEVVAVERCDEDKLKARFSNGDEWQGDAVLYATGRKPNTEGLGLENTAVQFNKGGYIEVDDRFRTAEPSIYALGDVVGRLELTPVALAEATTLARQLFGKETAGFNFDDIPTTIFSHPEVATVGLSEEAARKQFGDDAIAVYKSDFRHLRHTLSGRNARTFMKVVVRRSDDRVLGMHMVGDVAGEIIQGFAAAMTCHITKAQLDATIGIHPTAAEEFVTMREQSSS